MKSKFFKMMPVIAAVASLSFATGAFATGSSEQSGSSWGTSDNGNGSSNSGGSSTTSGSSSSGSSDNTNINISKNVGYTVNGNYNVGGTIGTSAQAMAMTNSTQSASNQAVTNHQILNQAGIETNSFQNASGLVNANSGAGTGFGQDNKVAISTLSGTGNASLDAETFGAQSLSNIGITNAQNDNISILKDSAFNGFKGMANLNIGTGTSYLQANEVAISAGDGVSSVSTASDTQNLSNLQVNNSTLANAYSTPGSQPDYLLNTPQNNAKVQGAFMCSSGLMNVNIGSGNGFAQSNNVAISSISSTK